MKYSEAKQGRTFVVRLEDGDVVHEALERFAAEQGIKAAALVILGGADAESLLVVGPEEGRQNPVRPMELMLDNVYEVAGTGTIFPDEHGKPVLHMHIAAGRGAEAVAGCVRKGVRVWHVMEAVVFELADTSACRRRDKATGFGLLEP